MEKHTQKIMEEYETKSQLYVDFCNAICLLVEGMLKDGAYKYHLTRRIKTAESLAEKIVRKKRNGKIYTRLGDIDDIAGVRLVFLSKSDREDMIGKLRKEFGEKLKVEETSKISGYRAMHAVVSFGRNRLRLSEYARFKGLKCEIQLTLILEHAWAEVEHDILYKQDEDMSQINWREYAALKKRMENVMNSYIKKGSEELEEITSRIRELKALSDQGTARKLAENGV